LVNFANTIFKCHGRTIRSGCEVAIHKSIVNSCIFARILRKLFFVAPEPNFKPSLRVMRHKRSQTVIPEPPDEPRSVELMQTRSLQARRISNVVNITGCDQHIAIATVLPEKRSRETLRLGTHTTYMVPAPGL
jgi:hypothetical protein